MVLMRKNILQQTLKRLRHLRLISEAMTNESE
jgi:hypothetical protein